MLFSDSAGLSWNRSEIIIARNGVSACAITEGMLVYITEEGIQSKYFPSIGLQGAFFSNEITTSDDVPGAGTPETYKEEIQVKFDEIEVIPIGSGQVNEQRLSGYQDNEGFYKVFYYNRDNVLVCSRSSDGNVWETHPNF